MTGRENLKGVWTGRNPRICDHELLRWIARFRFVPVDVLSDLACVTYSRLRRRIAELSKQGLVEIESLRYGRPRVVYLTRAGYRSAWLEVRRPPRIASANYDHERAVAYFALSAERSAPQGAQVVSEKEMRFLEHHRDEEWSVPLYGSAQRRHWPDLVLAHGDGHLTYVEIELERKNTQRLTELLKAYRAFSEAHAVLYFVNSAAIARAVKRSADVAGLNGRLLIKPWQELPAEQQDEIKAAVAFKKERDGDG